MKVYLVWKRDNYRTFIDEVLKIFLYEEKAQKWLTEYAEKWNLTRLDDFYTFEYTDGDRDYFIVEQEVEE